MSMAPVAPVTPATTAPPIPAARLAQIKKTAQQFEAIFVRQMLSAARKSGFGETMTSGPGTSSQGADTFAEMQDSRFADIASQKGAFGLARMIEKQLIHREAQSAGTLPKPAPAPAPAPGAPNPATGG